MCDDEPLDLKDFSKEDMQRVLQIFIENSESKTDPTMSVDSFVKFLQPVLRMSKREVELLFMKMDADSNGKVSWGEFAHYVMEMNNKAEVVASGDVVFDGSKFEESDTDIHHEDSVLAAVQMEHNGMLVSIDANGIIRAWGSSTGLSVTKLGSKGIRAVPSRVGVMSMTYLPRTAFVAVGSDDSKIRFFDANMLRHDLTFDCDGRWPVAMGTFDENINTLDSKGLAISEQRELVEGFAWGDNFGDMHIMLDSHIAGLRTQNEVVPFFKNSLNSCWDIPVFTTAMRDLTVAAKLPSNGQWGTPAAWFSVIYFVREVGMNGVLVTASTTGVIAVISIESKSVIQCFDHHRLAVKALAWCSRHNNVMASAGLDRSIQLWKLSAVKSTDTSTSGSLNGHTHGVIDLAFSEARDVLFSLDSKSIVLVWDLASRTLVGRLDPLSANPFDITHKVTRILVMQKSRHLVTWMNHPRFWGVRPLDLRDDTEKTTEHSANLVGCIYSKMFDRFVTVDRSGLVCLWQVSSGRQDFQFLCHEVEETSAAPLVTTMCCDESERRILIGWSQGSVQIYNYNNGILKNNLVSDSTAAVNALSHARYAQGKHDHRQLLVGAFEDGSILLWPSRPPEQNASPLRRIEAPRWAGAFFPEVAISTVSRVGNQRFIAGQKDGHVMMVDVQTGIVLKSGDGSVANLCCTGSVQIPLTASKVLHRRPVCIMSDSIGSIHFLLTEKLTLLASHTNLHGKKKSALPSTGVTALEVDETDSFLIIGESTGDIQVSCLCNYCGCCSLLTGGHEIQVWDISQIFENSVQIGLNLSLSIRLFRWKAHHSPVSSIVHVSEHNILVSTGSEGVKDALVWTIPGNRIGELGSGRWSKAIIAERIAESDRSNHNKIATEKGLIWSDPAFLRRPEGERRRRSIFGAQNTAATTVQNATGEEHGSEGIVPNQNALSEVEDQSRGPGCGQLSLTVSDIKVSSQIHATRKTDPYFIVKLEGHYARSLRLKKDLCSERDVQAFLYFIDTLEMSLQIEAYNYDPGQNHMFIGQLNYPLSALFKTSDCTEAWYPLTGRDGSHVGKTGSIFLGAEFQPIASEYEGMDGPRQLKEALKRLQVRNTREAVVPALHILQLPDPQQNNNVTAIATQRWSTTDFRRLSVYWMDNQQALRYGKQGRGRDSDGGGRPAASARADQPDSGLDADFKFPRDSLAGKLERLFDKGPQVPPQGLGSVRTNRGSITGANTASFVSPNAKYLDSDTSMRNVGGGSVGGASVKLLPATMLSPGRHKSFLYRRLPGNDTSNRRTGSAPALEQIVSLRHKTRRDMSETATGAAGGASGGSNPASAEATSRNAEGYTIRSNAMFRIVCASKLKPFQLFKLDQKPEDSGPRSIHTAR